LKNVRDGNKSSYNKIKKSHLADASDDALRSLATSYGASQIMGWHVILNLNCTIGDLRDPAKHFFYTVKLLQLNGFPARASETRMDAEMRQWNTGSEGGRTYHENYVPNAQAVRAEYAAIEKANPSALNLIDRLGAEFTEGEKTPDNPSTDGAKQVAENITNVNQGKTVPDNFVAEDKTVTAPASSGMLDKGWKWLVGLGLIPTTFGGLVEALRNLSADGEFNFKDVFAASKEIFIFLLPYLFWVGLAFVVFWGIKELLKQVSFLVTQYTTARPDMHNVQVLAAPVATPEPGAWRFAPLAAFRQPVSAVEEEKPEALEVKIAADPAGIQKTEDVEFDFDFSGGSNQ
ncbi:MAG TPA: hypothetical protein VK612_12950, partial [Pyrinomonadaceae bacterium]|nr:hypothetical protein [Pyrinomonadaceae bacterium]